MKRVLFVAVILCIFPFCSIASTNDELNYLWGIRIGSPITEAVSDFEKITGFELEPVYSDDGSSLAYYLSNNIIIRGNIFSVLFSKHTNELGQDILSTVYVSHDYLNTGKKVDRIDGYRITAELASMLMDSFGSPTSNSWSIPLNGKNYFFDVPFSEGSFDMELIDSLGQDHRLSFAGTILNCNLVSIITKGTAPLSKFQKVTNPPILRHLSEHIRQTKLVSKDSDNYQ